jgi:hypothetical protein
VTSFQPTHTADAKNTLPITSPGAAMSAKRAAKAAVTIAADLMTSPSLR